MSAHTESPPAASGPDPYGNFLFRVKCDGRYVAGVSKVSALTTQGNGHSSGAHRSPPLRIPGQSEYTPIILERGVTRDVAFAQWANHVWDSHPSTSSDPQDGAGDQDVALNDFRKDIILELYNEAGQKVLAYTIYRCWPSEFIAMPVLDGNGNEVAIQSLKLENEGWQRDTSVL